MPSLTIPESGISLESSYGGSRKGGPAEAIGVSLTNNMIEEMIRCVQDGKLIQLSLGKSISMSYGNQVQNFSSSPDPFTHQLYGPPDDFQNSKMHTKVPLVKKSTLEIKAMFGAHKLTPAEKKQVSAERAARVEAAKTTAGSDAALATLQNSLASETARKEQNTTKIIKGPVGRGGPGNKSKFLNKSLSSGAPRSMPSSPALSGVGSPALGPTSAPASQQQAQKDKAARRPVIHLLAADPLTESALQDMIPELNQSEIKAVLSKVADPLEGTNKWELRKQFYKELDVWSFSYENDAEVQRAVNNAVKVYDKMRLGTSEPQWERLLEPSERGTGKCLSKLQSKIAQGPIGRPKTNESGRDTEDEHSGEKKSNGEAMARSGSSGPATKNKKVSEKEAQARRLLSTKPSKVTKPAQKQTPKAAPKSSVTKKAVPTKTGPKPLSSEFVGDSDEDDVPPPVKKALPKPSIKRQREEDFHDSSDSSIPLSKKVKKDIKKLAPTAPNINHRVSDASQSSANTTATIKSNNSPHKSSPLASSPPTNASDFDSSGGSQSPVSKLGHHHKTSSVTSSVSSNGTRYLSADTIDLARRYKSFYPNYVLLYKELAAMRSRDPEKEEKLMTMHKRLEGMKREIAAGIIEVD